MPLLRTLLSAPLSTSASLALAALLVSAPAFPAGTGADRNTIAIHGFDKMSCLDWTLSRDNAAIRQLYIAWLRGIVTGYNYATPDDQVALGQMPTDLALASYVDHYCSGRALTSFAAAAFALIDEIRVHHTSQTGDETELRTPDDSTDHKAGDEDFDHWLKHQSADMRSLDIGIQRKIYQKEMELKGQ